MIDFRPVEKWCDIATLMYARQTLGIQLAVHGHIEYIYSWME
jgi:hypothetical protein